MAERLFTVREIAGIIGVTKPTVQKAINSSGAKPHHVDQAKRRFYDRETVLQILQKMNPYLDIGEYPQFAPNVDNAENVENQSQMSENKPPNGENGRQESQNVKSPELALLREAMDTLRDQLAEKDKQLAVKDQQIKDLSDRLADALAVTRGQQYISAADKTKDLIEAQDTTPKPKPETGSRETPPRAEPVKQKTQPPERRAPRRRTWLSILFKR